MPGLHLANSFGPQQRARVESGEYAGFLASPATYGIPQGIKAGATWAGDNGCFSSAYTSPAFWDFLVRFIPYRARCLFVVAPDVVGDCWATMDRWTFWWPQIKFREYPVAFVGQDNQPPDLIPWHILDCYFVGGTDAWKDSSMSLAIVSKARDFGKRVHIGRANTRPRLEAFIKAYRRSGDEGLPGFTYDGTGERFPGKKQEIAPAFAFLKQERLL